MAIGILIIAHAPLASAWKNCCLHIFSAAGDAHAEEMICYDVFPDTDLTEGVREAKTLLKLFDGKQGVLVLTDLIGATPSNIAVKLSDHPNIRVVAGVNLPALVAVLSAGATLCVDQAAQLAESAAHAGIQFVTLTSRHA